ncbi:amidase family protein [Nocardia sp. CA-136227]|uniref:amidase family protein n=1 Tax=Nocardia sp. CA-136227 TaxID=3239979 RepID=UPI003D989FC9
MEFDPRVWREWGAPLVAATGDGPLSGHTVAVKDLYAVAGYPLGGGVPEFLGAPKDAHAAVVSRLLAAGADITGVAHTDEFAYSITGGNGRYGMPINPAAPQRIPGGSSSGSAVAVARGEVCVGLGTDTAGSIRVPAAYQGLWGMRTSYGSISTMGLLPLAESFDTVGWMTRDLDTLQSVAECLLPKQNSGPYELIVDPDLCAVADDEVAEAGVKAAKRLGAVDYHLNADLESWFTAFRKVQAFEAWQNHGAWISAHPGALESEVGERFRIASTVTVEEASASRAVLQDAAGVLRDALRGRFLVLPTVATLPPLRVASAGALESGRTRTLHLTCLASIVGGPAISFPLTEIRGIPSSLCLVGAPGMDWSLISMLGETVRDTGHFGFPE